MTFKFTIPGDPHAQGRPRFARMGKFVKVYDPKESVDFKKKVAEYAQAAGVRCQADGPIIMAIVWYFKRPQRLLTKASIVAPVPHFVKPDADNLEKAICDGLNGIAYKDDSQVYHVEKFKFYHEIGGVPRTEVTIY